MRIAHRKPSTEDPKDMGNPNLEDVFLPKHDPIHIDPQTHIHYQISKSGEVRVEENIDLGSSVRFGDPVSDNHSSSHAKTSHKHAEASKQGYTPVIGSGGVNFSGQAGDQSKSPFGQGNSYSTPQNSKHKAGEDHRVEYKSPIPDDPAP